ncbi:MAG TPA: alpha-amylase [Propionibacterium sp.]|nr:alpha-amylase [Propionibacterium sp.]
MSKLSRVPVALAALALALTGCQMAPPPNQDAADPAATGPVSAPLRAALTREQFYFVMADRFANGDPSNDTGGIAGDRLAHGFDPTDKGFYHGGDLRGLIDRLDYIEGLGTTAIWLTPSFKNRAVQGAPGSESAGYHGYWITDFTQIDPHLGTNDEMKELIEAAHARGMKVFFDIITNHTADVITNAEGATAYRPKSAAPYRDASGAEFDDRDVVGQEFPPLDAATSFPYPPVFAQPEDATVKVPDWLNDPTMYHNRGNSTFDGESDTYGDFAGLDDLFTERPEVVDGMAEIYEAWVDLGIDGFRIDTVKHVNIEFWQEFGPRLLEHARAAGNDDFFMFGEVYDALPQVKSAYTTAGRLPAALDFGFQRHAVAYASGKPAEPLRDLWVADDHYTDADSNAYQLPTFLGNHDMGRVALHLRGSGASGEDLLQRARLANELMFLSRGQPVVYYGDEQGFIGAGGDKDARQDMFATQVASYAGEDVLGGPSGAVDRFDTEHPLYRQVSDLAALRREHPALADGAQVMLHAGDGILAFSRIDGGTGTEYLVAFNNTTTDQPVTVTTHSPGTWQPVLAGTGPLTADDTALALTVPALGAVVYRADQPIPDAEGAPQLALTSPKQGGQVTGPRFKVEAEVSGEYAHVSFGFRAVGTEEWQPLGVDDNAPYRVFPALPPLPEGTEVEYRAVARDLAGNTATATTTVTVGAG